MNRHKRDITQETLELMTQQSKRIPVLIKDYCHYDSCPTDWYLVRLTNTVKGLEITYHCVECETKRHYKLEEFE